MSWLDCVEIQCVRFIIYLPLEARNSAETSNCWCFVQMETTLCMPVSRSTGPHTHFIFDMFRSPLVLITCRRGITRIDLFRTQDAYFGNIETAAPNQGPDLMLKVSRASRKHVYIARDRGICNIRPASKHDSVIFLPTPARVCHIIASALTFSKPFKRPLLSKSWELDDQS